MRNEKRTVPLGLLLLTLLALGIVSVTMPGSVTRADDPTPTLYSTPTMLATPSPQWTPPTRSVTELPGLPLTLTPGFWDSTSTPPSLPGGTPTEPPDW
jgi:hypothetical protein